MKQHNKRLTEIERRVEPEKELFITMNGDEYDALTPEQLAELEAKYETLILIRYRLSDTPPATSPVSEI